MPPLRLNDPAWLVLTTLRVSRDARRTSSPSSWSVSDVDARGACPCPSPTCDSLSASGLSAAGDTGALSPSTKSGNRWNAGPRLEWLSLCVWLGFTSPSTIAAASAAACAASDDTESRDPTLHRIELFPMDTRVLPPSLVPNHAPPDAPLPRMPPAAHTGPSPPPTVSPLTRMNAELALGTKPGEPPRSACSSLTSMSAGLPDRP
mmetsp:Transcript_7101/g.32060  ORF Transcript_7101/g.32060 Transcript_7101/m.32060 type:complete len:205 (+) Transcript_7101:333-947(+)